MGSGNSKGVASGSGSTSPTTCSEVESLTSGRAGVSSGVTTISSAAGCNG